MYSGFCRGKVHTERQNTDFILQTLSFPCKDPASDNYWVPSAQSRAVFKNWEQHLWSFWQGALKWLGLGCGVTHMGRWHQWLGALEIRGTEEDTRTGTGMSLEALECRGVWLRRNWIFSKEFLPLWHLCPGACLGDWGNVWGSVSTCRGHVSPDVLLRASFSPASLYGWHCFGVCKEMNNRRLQYIRGEESPDSGNLNPVEAFSNKQEFLRERFAGVSWGVRRKGWPDKRGSKKFGSYSHQFI